MKKELIKMIKKNLAYVLIALGIILGYIFKLYAQFNNLSGANSWVGIIGMIIIGVPILSGVWLISNKIKNKDKGSSKVIKIFAIIGIIMLMGTIILIMLSLLVGFDL